MASKVVGYHINEVHPGHFVAYVTRKGLFKTTYGLDFAGRETIHGGCTEFSREKAQRNINLHKKLEKTPFIPKTIYSEKT